MPCKHSHEGFCIAEFEDPTQRCRFAFSELKVCIATDEDLVEGYEECEICGGPDTFKDDDSPCPAPLPRETCWRLSIKNGEQRREP